MKKIHKRLLGVGGIALVAAITTVAYQIPDVGAMTASAEVNVTVNVLSNNPEIKINSPLDGAKLVSPILNIKTRFADADQIEYILTKGSQSVMLPAPALPDPSDPRHGSSGEHDFNYNLKEFNPSTAGYGNYVLKVTIKRNETVLEDNVSFSYIPASVDDGTIPTDENNNPIVDLNVKPSVVKAEAIVFDKDGNKVFAQPVVGENDGSNKIYFTIPFFENDKESGNYTVKFITYSYNGYGQLVPDQTEESTDLQTQVTYKKKAEPIIPDDDTPTTPLNPSAGDPNNPTVPAPAGTVEGDMVHVVIVDPTTGEVVVETELPVNKDGTVTIPLDGYNIPAGDYKGYLTPYNVDPSTGEATLDPSRTKVVDIHYEGKSANWQITTNKDNGNPILTFTNDGTVKKAKFVITDKNGKEIDTIIVDIKPDQTKIELPFDELGLVAGDYGIKPVTYSTNPKTGKLAPNQNPYYVRPIPFTYRGANRSYEFLDKDNKLGTHTWNRNTDAGKSEVFRILESDTYSLFNAREVFFVKAADLGSLFSDASRLNPLRFVAYDDEGGLRLELLSSYLATLPNGDYYLGVRLANGADRMAKLTVTGDTGTNNNNPNPVIDINVEEGVVMVEIIVYDKNGNEIFRFKVPVTSATTNHIELPFDLYNLPDGEYLVAVIPYAYDENGNLVPLISEEEAKKNAIKIYYGAPEVPNTGDFFSSLNLSEKDFLLTGLIIFAAVTAGGVFFLKKKESHR